MIHTQSKRMDSKHAVRPTHKARPALIARGAFTFALLLACFLSACTTLNKDPEPLACNDQLKQSFKPDALTKVVSVRAIVAGESLLAVDSNLPVKTTQAMCLVKLLVGPGVTAEKDPKAFAYSEGIGIEVWLPTPLGWNQRIRDYGGGGWVGGGHRYPEQIGSKLPAIVNANLGYAVGTTDAGQPHYQDGSFVFLSSGQVNFEGLRNFSSLSLVETAKKTQALVKHYYGKAHQFAYFDGHSQGGRQALKLAQDYPELYNGFMVGQPAVSVNQYGLLGIYTQLLLKHELGFTAANREQAASYARKVELANRRAVQACDSAKLGFLLDPLSCNYDPTQDQALLCDTAATQDRSNCMSPREAQTLMKIWRGPTKDGSKPVASTPRSRAGVALDSDQLWWGYTPGTAIGGTITGAGADHLAIAMQNLAYATDATTARGLLVKNNAVKERNQWLNMSYAELVAAHQRILAMQPQLNHFMTDKADLSKLQQLGRKVLMHTGLADDAIPPASSIHYYERVAATQLGNPSEQLKQLQSFFRMYMVPGMAHSSQGRAYTLTGRNDFVPMPALPGNLNQAPSREQDPLFSALQDWVEKGIAPGEPVVTAKNAAVSYPLCLYPRKIRWDGKGPLAQASSFTCE